MHVIKIADLIQFLILAKVSVLPVYCVHIAYLSLMLVVVGLLGKCSIYLLACICVACYRFFS